MDEMMLTTYGSLAEVIARNSVEIIRNKVTTITSQKASKETNTALIEIINELLKDKQDLILIAQQSESELTARNLNEDDIKYITTNIKKIVETITGISTNPEESDFEAIKDLLTPELIRIMQMIGYSFKEGIGQPLTNLTKSLIQSQAPQQDQLVLAEKQIDLEKSVIDLTFNEDSYIRYCELKGINKSEN